MNLIKVVVRDKNNVSVKLTGLVKGIENPRGLYARFGVQGLRWVDENFKKQGGLLKEGKWQKLADSTIKRRQTRKKKRTKSQLILIDSGDLKRDFDTRFTSRGVWIGTPKEYAVFHDSDRPRKKLPHRRVLPRQKDDTMISRLRKTLRNYIREKGQNIFR